MQTAIQKRINRTIIFQPDPAYLFLKFCYNSEGLTHVFKSVSEASKAFAELLKRIPNNITTPGCRIN
jgi:hypothetical protein